MHVASLRKAWTKWIGYSETVNNAVRMKLLHLHSTERLALSQSFHNLRAACRDAKFARLRRLKLCFHGWKNYNRYNRHLMLSNLAAIGFVQSNNTLLMKNCFDELRLHKENKKNKILSQALMMDIDPSINNLEEYNEDKSTAILQANKLRAIRAVSDQM